MPSDEDSDVGNDSGTWDLHSRIRRHGKLIEDLRITDKVRDNEIKHLIKSVDELRWAVQKVAWFVFSNILLWAGGLILAVVIWAIKQGATP